MTEAPRYRHLNQEERLELCRFIREYVPVARDKAKPFWKFARWQISLLLWRWTADAYCTRENVIRPDAIKYDVEMLPATKTSKGYTSARDFVDTCLTLTGPNGTSGSVAVGAVIDDQTTGADDDLPVVLVVGINYGQGAGYLASPIPTTAKTGLRPKLQKAAQLLDDRGCSAQILGQSFHLVAANFFPWITSRTWSSYRLNSIEEAALIFCCGHADSKDYILELIRQIDPVAVIFHGANNAVPYLGTGVVQQSLAGASRPAFDVIFSDNLAGSRKSGVSNTIRLCCLDANRAAMAVTDFNEQVSPSQSNSLDITR